MIREVFSGAGAAGLIALQAAGNRTPLFLVHGGDGRVLSYAVLARRLGPDQPSYGLRARGLDDNPSIPSSLVEMAADYVADVRGVQPHGPCVPGGACLG
jgi:thioesterase domain-containing protein